MKLYLNCHKDEAQRTWNKADYLLVAAKRLGLEDRVELYNKQDDADYILNIEPFSPLIQGKKWTGVWEIDTLLDRAEMKVDNWIASTVVFTANGIIPRRMQIFEGDRRILFQACEPIIHKRNLKIEPQYDFVFSGSVGLKIYEERERVMNLLRKEGFTFMDFPKERPPHEYVDFLSHARVQFIRSMDVGGDGEIAQRFFECLAIGPVLTNYVKDLDSTGLVEGEDYLAYHDDKEMLEKMHFLIDNPDKANIIASNGRKKALLYHTYENRLVTIFNIIEEYERSLS